MQLGKLTRKLGLSEVYNIVTEMKIVKCTEDRIYNIN